MKFDHETFIALTHTYDLCPKAKGKSNGDFFSAKKMSPCYKVHKKNC